MDQELTRLSALDTCAASDALDALGIGGVAFGLTALSAARRIVGRAITVQLGVDDARVSRRHLCTAAVEASGPGTIIVIAHGGRTEVAGWGGLLSLSAFKNGVEGIVIDGACRDLDESREMGLTIYARCSVPVTARGRIMEIQWNAPVEIAGIRVSPNDLLIADGSGVVVIPQAEADRAITLAEAVSARERLMANAIRQGDPVSRVMGAAYEDMLSGGTR